MGWNTDQRLNCMPVLYGSWGGGWHPGRRSAGNQWNYVSLLQRRRCSLSPIQWNPEALMLLVGVYISTMACSAPFLLFVWNPREPRLPISQGHAQTVS